MKAKYLYHVTQKFSEPILRVDHREVTGWRRSLKEPTLPRLCVAPSVSQCLVASVQQTGKPVSVYRTVKPYKGVKPYEVWDWVITDERWLLPPCKLELVDEIPADDVDAINFVPEFYHSMGFYSSLELRLAHVLMVNEVRPDFVPKKLRITAEKFMKEWVGVDDPMEVYLQQLQEEQRKQIPNGIKVK